MKAHKSTYLAEIFQKSAARFSFPSEDGTVQATAPAKCRDFLSDVLAVNWGYAKSANIYGFMYSKSPMADSSKLIVEDIKEQAAELAARLLGVNMVKVAIDKKAAYMYDIGSLGDSTFGVSLASHIVRCCDFVGKPSDSTTIEDAMKASDVSPTDGVYSRSIISVGGKRFLNWVRDNSSKLGNMQKDFSPCGSMSSFHDHGGIYSLANRSTPWSKINEMYVGK